MKLNAVLSRNMTYTGTVSPGQAQTRELSQLAITKVSVGPMDNNAYLLECRTSGQLALIDAANDADVLLELINNRPLASIITTHRHPDHWQALRTAVAATDAETIAHSADADAIPVFTTKPVNDASTVRFGAITLDIIHLGGHTPGSMCLLYHHQDDGDHLFTGDCLFPGGPGKTTTPTNFHTLIDGLETRIFRRLPDSTVVYPGHGKDTTLGVERPALPHWKARGW